MNASPARFIVRKGHESDGTRLLALMRASTVAGGVRWYVTPGTDAFASLRAERDGWSVALAEDEVGQLLGFLSVATRFVEGADGPTRCCYVTNLLVLPEHRGRGIGDALCRHAVELCRHSGGDSVPILMVIRTGNASMRGRIGGPRGLPPLAKFADVEVHAVATARAARVATDGVDVSAARPGDLPEMAALWTGVAAERQFTPSLDATGLAQWIDGAPGLTLDDYLVARLRGRIVGWIGWWDELAMRVVRIAGYTFAGAVRRTIQDAAARLTGGRRPAAVGARVGCLRAVHACVPNDRPDVLTALIVEGARRHVADCSWLKIALDVRDPLKRALRDLRSQATEFDARLTSPSGSSPLPLDSRPLHLDAALI